MAEREGGLTSPAPSQTQQSKFLTWQFDGEYRGDDYTATLTLGNPDLIGESGEEWDRVLLIGCPPAAVGNPLHHLSSSGIGEEPVGRPGGSLRGRQAGCCL